MTILAPSKPFAPPNPLRNKPWEYLFYVDFLGHVDDKVVERVLKTLSKRTLFLRVLGSYPEQGLKQA